MSTYLMRYRGENGEEDIDLDDKDSDITFEASSDNEAHAKARRLAENNRPFTVYERTGVIKRKKD